MREPPLQQEAEGIRSRVIWWTGLGVIVVSALLVMIAWWLVAPPTAINTAAQESPLKRDLFERANAGPDLHAAGAQALERTQWVDRKAGVIRIPIERAIDAVVADPKLIGARPATISRTTSAAALDPQADPATRENPRSMASNPAAVAQ